MKTTTIICDHCGNSIQKPLKEAVRQQRIHGPNTRFFCSRKCSGHGNRKNFGAYYNGNAATLIADNRRDIYTPFRAFLRAALKRHACVDIDLLYLKELWEVQKGICALTGLEMTLERGITPTRQASLDRIDSNKGYTKGNVQYVVMPINLAKNQMTDDAIKKWIADIRNVI
jgi:hypothetical protein